MNKVTKAMEKTLYKQIEESFSKKEAFSVTYYYNKKKKTFQKNKPSDFNIFTHHFTLSVSTPQQILNLT